MTTALTSTDSFSWRRTAAFGRLYSRPIRIQLLIYLAIIVVTYALSMTASSLGFPTLTITILSIFGFSLYFIPAVFAVRQETLLGQLPAKASEKTLFYVLWAVVAMPLLCEGAWYLISGLGTLLFDLPFLGGSASLSRLTEMPEYLEHLSFGEKVVIFSANCLVFGSCIAAMLHGVLRARSHRVVWGVVWLLGYLFTYGVISFAAGVYIAVSGALNGTLTNLSGDEGEMIAQVVAGLNWMYIGLSVYGLVSFILFITLIYRGQLRRQYPDDAIQR